MALGLCFDTGPRAPCKRLKRNNFQREYIREILCLIIIYQENLFLGRLLPK